MLYLHFNVLHVLYTQKPRHCRLSWTAIFQCAVLSRWLYDIPKSSESFFFVYYSVDTLVDTYDVTRFTSTTARTWSLFLVLIVYWLPLTFTSITDAVMMMMMHTEFFTNKVHFNNCQMKVWLHVFL